jgi:hypothetical protein
MGSPSEQVSNHGTLILGHVPYEDFGASEFSNLPERLPASRDTMQQMIPTTSQRRPSPVTAVQKSFGEVSRFRSRDSGLSVLRHTCSDMSRSSFGFRSVKVLTYLDHSLEVKILTIGSTRTRFAVTKSVKARDVVLHCATFAVLRLRRTVYPRCTYGFPSQMKTCTKSAMFHYSSYMSVAYHLSI